MIKICVFLLKLNCRLLLISLCLNQLHFVHTNVNLNWILVLYFFSLCLCARYIWGFGQTGVFILNQFELFSRFVQVAVTGTWFFWYFSLKTSDSVYRRTILRLNGYRSVNEKVFNAVLTVGIFFNRNFLPNCILTCLENAWVEEEREEEQICSNEFISDVSSLILVEMRDNSLMVMVHMACANRWTVKRKEAIYYLLKIHEWTTILCAHDHWLLFFVER